MPSRPTRTTPEAASPYRESLHSVEVKVPNPNAPGFRAMARDQSHRIAESEAENDLLDWSEAAAASAWKTLPQ